MVPVIAANLLESIPILRWGECEPRVSSTGRPSSAGRP